MISTNKTRMEFPSKYLLLVILIIAVILDIVAVAIPYWNVSGKGNYGLWKVCNDGNCIEISAKSEGFPTSQGLHMFALIVGVVTSILYIITEVVGVISGKIGKWLVVSLSILAGAFILIANSYMAKRLLLYPTCHVMSLISAAFFIFVGGFLTSANKCDSS